MVKTCAISPEFPMSETEDNTAEKKPEIPFLIVYNTSRLFSTKSKYFHCNAVDSKHAFELFATGRTEAYFNVQIYSEPSLTDVDSLEDFVVEYVSRGDPTSPVSVFECRALGHNTARALFYTSKLGKSNIAVNVYPKQKQDTTGAPLVDNGLARRMSYPVQPAEKEPQWDVSDQVGWYPAGDPAVSNEKRTLLTSETLKLIGFWITANCPAPYIQHPYQDFIQAAHTHLARAPEEGDFLVRACYQDDLLATSWVRLELLRDDKVVASMSYYVEQNNTLEPKAAAEQ